MSRNNRVSPQLPEHHMTVTDYDPITDWSADDGNSGNDQKYSRNHNNNKILEGKITQNGNGQLRQRRRRDFEPGSEDYAAYVEKRIFNKREAWTPFLWQRKRDKRLVGNLNPTRGWKGWKHRQKMKFNSMKLTWNEWTASLELWRDSLKRIEGQQGTGVVSYFIFLKFLLFLNMFIFLAMFWAVVFFQVTFDSAGYSKKLTGYDDSTSHPGVALAGVCTGQYNKTKTSGFQAVLDFFQGSGWMETTAFYYGYYSNQELSIPGGTYNLPLAYFMTTLVVFLVSLIVMVHHTFSKYMDTLVVPEVSRQLCQFFNTVLCAWDFRVCETEPVHLQKKHFYHRVVGELEEQRHELRRKSSSRLGRCCLWLVRIIINMFIIILLAGSAAAIYYAQNFASDFTTSDTSEDFHMFIVLFVEYLPSMIIVVLNGVYPILFTLIVKAERYKPAVVIKITILRIVFVRLAALFVITAVIYREVTCSPSDQCLVGQGECPKIQCWETYFGQQIYKFCLTELVVDIVITLGYELPRKLITTKCDCGIAKKIGPAEFDIPINVLDLVYAQALCWLGLFFVPLITAVTVVRLVILFYLRKLSALYNTVPPERPYHASRSNAFFMVTLLVTFFLVSVPTGYVLVQLQPSPMCGPFQIYSVPTDLIQIQIDTGSSWFKTVWTIVTSSAFIAVVMLLLILVLYYCSTVKSANSKVIKTLKSQIMQDDKDKHYLIQQLSKYTNNYKCQDKQFIKPTISVDQHQHRYFESNNGVTKTSENKGRQSDGFSVNTVRGMEMSETRTVRAEVNPPETLKEEENINTSTEW